MALQLEIDCFCVFTLTKTNTNSIVDNPSEMQEDLVLGKKMASGGFGTVYKAGLIDAADPNAAPRDVILKKVPFPKPPFLLAITQP